MSSFFRLYRSAAACLLSILTLAAATHAQQTLRVPDAYTTIQAAINAASTGDTVLVAPGTYPENLTLASKQITLRSTAGAATTLLDGQHLGPILQVTDTAGLLTTIDGFTFQNGGPQDVGNSGSTPAGTTAGIYAVRSGLSVTNSVFQKNSGTNLNIINGTLHLSNSTIATAPETGSVCWNAGPDVPGAVLAATGIILTGDSAITTLGSPSPSVIVGNTIFGDGTSCSADAIELQSLSVPPLLQNNVLRANLTGIGALYAPFHLLQNLIYDNGLGAITIEGPRTAGPSTDPATTLITNNTIVNNHTSHNTLNGPSTTEININNVAAQVALRNNILVGTTQYALLSCQSPNASNPNDTPLLLDHNDLFNTSGGAILTGNCFSNLASPLTTNGNLTVDPRLTASTDLHPLPGSPVLDAGFNLLDEPATDLDGNPRLADVTAKGYPTIDLGAYEHSSGASPTSPTALELRPSAFVVAPGTLTLTAGAHTLSATGPAVLPTGAVTLLLNGAATLSTAALDVNGNATLSISLTTPGVYALSATLAPSLGLAPAVSPVLYVLVLDAPATTTLAITASPTTTTLNQPITLKVQLGSTTGSGASAQPGPVPPGAVSLSEGSTFLSNLDPDSTGRATYTVPNPTLGSHTYTVTYAGTDAFSSATADTAVAVTQPVATSITARATPNPVPLGASVTLTATVTPTSGAASPTGAVTFTDGAKPLGSPALANGIASISTSSLSLGLHTITITYTPDAGFSPSNGATTVNVGGSATMLSLSSTHSPATVGDPVRFTVSVAYAAPGTTAAAPAGSVRLMEGETLIASAPLTPNSTQTAGLAALTAPFTVAGPHILTATFVPATPADVTSSGTVTQTVTNGPTATVVLTITPSNASTTQPLAFTAAITYNGSAPTGITFFDGATPLGGPMPLNPNAIADTITSITRPGALSAGPHTITAVVTNAAGEIVGSSNEFVETIHAQPTSLALAASPAPSAIAGAPVTLTATLTGAVAGSPAPVGTVTFFDGSAVLGPMALTPDGRATFTTSSLAPGPHTLTATYSGDTIFSASAAPPIAETITSNATSTSITVLPSTSTAFAPVTLTAHVTSAAGGAAINTPTCNPGCTPVTLTFFADTPAGRLPLGTAALDATRAATLVITPAAGAYSVFATFNGSTLIAPSTSPAAPLTVSLATAALTLTATPTSVYQHTAVRLTAVLSAAGVPPTALTGVVTFLEGSTVLGSAPLATAGSFSWTPSSVGAHTVTAVFAGNTNLTGASATVTVTVLASDFTVTVKDASLTIRTEHHAPTTVDVTATGSLADIVSLSCANLPQYGTCTFTPATVDLTQSNHVSSTLMVDTDALLYYASAAPPSPPRSLSGTLTAVLALCLPPTFLAAFTRLRRRRAGLTPSPRTRMPHLLATLLLSATAALTLSGCSGRIPPHVAPGTYPITVVAHAQNSNVDHTTTFTLIVTP